MLLEGFRVIEWGVLLNGDYLGSLLADLGADVIKIESPWQGDYLRDSLGQIRPHESPAHVQVNKSKRSMTLNLREAVARDVFWRMIESADVFVDGTAGTSLSRLGIGYHAQREQNPGIVYVQVSGYGNGPMGEVPTHGEMMRSLAGARPQAVDPNGAVVHVEDESAFGGTTSGASGSVAAGLFGVQYTLAALLHRTRTGEGTYIDVSAAEAVVATAWQGAVYGLNDSLISDRSGIPLRNQEGGAGYGWFETADGEFVILAALEARFWNRFCTAIGREDLSRTDEAAGSMQFSTGDDDSKEQIRKLFRSRTQAEWMEFAKLHHVPLGPAYGSVRQVAEDPHVRSRELFFTEALPEGEEFTYVARPAVIPQHPFTVQRPAPKHGQHTEEILLELDYSPDEIAQLRSTGAV